MYTVRTTIELQHGDRFLSGVNNPVLRDTRCRIVGAFDHRVALDIVGADNLHHQVRAEPEGVLIPWVVDIEEQDQVWLAKAAWRDAHPQRRVEHRTAEALHGSQEGEEEEARDRQVFACWYRQNLHGALCEFNETVRLVCESEVL